MSGFAGYISNVGNIDEMAKFISQNGNAFKYESEKCAFALSDINDNIRALKYESADGFLIAFQGKIYNSDALKTEIQIDGNISNDAELILLGYKKFGKDMVKMLDGMFSFAIYNVREDVLLIARDGCGIKPIYYHIGENCFVFATETRAISAFSGFKKELNEEILSAFLCYGHVPTNETLFKGVFRLEPGHILTYKNGIIEKECFFKLEFANADKTESEFIDEIHASVVKSIEKHTSGVNYATFLSSGVDSSYIASTAKPKVTFTAGYSDRKYDESLYTKELADKLGIENRVKTVTPEEYLSEFAKIISCMDTPLSNPSMSSIYFGTQAVAESGFDVIISGEGADELFGGYNSYKEEISHGGYMKIPYGIRHFIYLLTKPLPSKKFDFFARRGQKIRDYHIGLDRIFKDDEAQKIIKNKNQIHTKSVSAPYYDYYGNCSTMKQRQAIDFYFWLINDFVHCVVRSADNFGLEARFPLLGSEVIDIARSVPDEYKLKDGMTKWIFRMAAKKVIPNDAHSRKKLGFPVPLKEWIKRDDFYAQIKSKFDSDNAKKFFDTSAIIKMLDDHKSGNADNYKKVWTIYTFLVWYELNFG